MARTDLTFDALKGYNANQDGDCPYLYSSPAWYAYQIGRHFRLTDRGEPQYVYMGRGYKINASGLTFEFRGKNDAIVKVES